MADTINPNGDTDETARPPRGEAKPRTTPRSSKRTSSQGSESNAKNRTPADRKLASSVAEMYMMFGMLLGGIGDVRQDAGMVGTGQALAVNSEAIAETWMDLADKNSKVKSALKSLTEVSVVGALVGIHVTCAMPLLASRGVVPAFAHNSEPVADPSPV